MRIISAAFVLGLGIVGITLAQQTGERPKDQAGEKGKLRAQVVKLRLEIELLELDHDAERDNFLACLKRVKQTEFLGNGQPGPAGTLGLGMLGMRAFVGEAELGIRAFMGDPEAGRAIEELAKEMARADEKGEDAGAAERNMVERALEKQDDGVRVYLDRKKKDYARQAAELAEKRLDLAEVEKRYNEAK